jgi:nucleotide-binding universal stress UspA family protein
VPSVTVNAVNGFAATELIEASRDADLIIVGARGRAHVGGLAQHMPIGSVSNKVLHHAECPVVVVPAHLMGLAPDRTTAADRRVARRPAI